MPRIQTIKLEVKTIKFSPLFLACCVQPSQLPAEGYGLCKGHSQATLRLHLRPS
eukprot:12346.XXX_893133_893294_1 [CDS] Oithona nana genome sequencing.